MAIKVMTPEECREMLARTGFGRLGCARNNQPYIVPIYFAYEADCLYGFSLCGQKIDWLRENSRACVEADEVKSQYEWKSVIATGKYEELVETPEHSSERLRAEQLLKQRYMWWQTACEVFHGRQTGEIGAFLFYSIRVLEISGLRAVPELSEYMPPL